LFAPELVEALNALDVVEDKSQTPRGSMNGHDTFNSVSRLELEGYMANTLLRDTDSMSMAHSLEVRVPFVDAEVTSFILNLPGEWKLNTRGYDGPKPLLAEVIEDLLPADFLGRKKMGFTLPFERWMVGELRGELSDAFANSELLNNSGVDHRSAQEVWRNFSGAPKAIGWSRPWALYVLAKWCELNTVTV
jgi:asparagine synthase (glutamine-hydrolysing)